MQIEGKNPKGRCVFGKHPSCTVVRYYLRDREMEVTCTVCNDVYRKPMSTELAFQYSGDLRLVVDVAPSISSRKV